MSLKLRFVVALLVAPLMSSAEDIKVTNGGPWGIFGERKMCPAGTYAHGFSIQVEKKRFGGDDTALNGIRLLCKHKDKDLPTDETVESPGPYGDWAVDKLCPSGRLDAFQLRVEPRRGGLDDTAANNIRFHCTDGGELEGDGLSWGSWGEWSPKCASGICGLQTKTEGKRGSADDTGLNDAIMICCSAELV
ncbi:hypothetical protein ACEWY4_017025 [Coilia grayii]|uniref:Vitelline membrane outer layer protein 1 homolog n=1 Tax=Coilia grayii TaxID=363190 RepID=A0ABD1JM87_9TELE